MPPNAYWPFVAPRFAHAVRSARVPSLIFGAGYIGAALAEHLCSSGLDVVAADNGFATDLHALQGLTARHTGRLRLLSCDIRDSAAVAQAFLAASPVDAVYLLAAQASAHADAAPAEYTEETNLRGPRLVLEAALRNGAPPIVYGSSFHVYGASLQGEIGENRPYGAFRDLSHLSKVYVEKLGELFAREHSVPFAPVRLGIVYGIGPVVKRDSRFITVPHAFALRVARGEVLRVHPSGLSFMGFIHLRDSVSALVSASRLLTAREAYCPINAVGEVASVVDVARSIVRSATGRGINASVDVPSDRDALGATRSQAFSVTSRLSAAGWQPTARLDEEAGALIDHYRGVVAEETTT